MRLGAIFVLLTLVLFVVSESVGQEILIKISILGKENIEVLSVSNLKIVAKGGDYFLAQVNQPDLQNLSGQGIVYQVLDENPEPGVYYQIWCRPDEKIDKYAKEIEARALLLDTDGSAGIIRGDPRKIEELTSQGLSLRLIPRTPLLLEPKVLIQIPKLTSFSSPVVDTIVDRVTSSELTGYVADLSGENSVIIGGSPYTINTRYSYTPGCDSAAQFIKEKFESFGLTSWYDTFTINSQSHVNVVAELPGQTYPGQECLITAHYDATSNNPSVDAPGADDNGSGTAAVLAAADILKDFDFHRTVKFVCFAGEEQGLLGSYSYAQKAWQRGDSIVGVYNLDMMAWEGDNNNIMELHAGTDPSSGNLADIAIGVISDYGLPLPPQKVTAASSGASDHSSFWNFGYPAILEIEDFQDFNPAYHTVGDLLSIFDVPYYTNLSKVAIASVALLADPVGCVAIPGDANASGGNPNLTDIIYLVNYVFKGGSAPSPLCRGDANGSSGNPNLTDIVYLIIYVFKGGPATLRSGVCCL